MIGLLFGLVLCFLALSDTVFVEGLFAQNSEQQQDPRISGKATEKVCLGCHGLEKDPAMVQEGRASSIEINGGLAARSVHGAEGIGCIECHTELPHEFGLPMVKCGSCHEREAAVYGRSILENSSFIVSSAFPDETYPKAWRWRLFFTRLLNGRFARQ